MFYEDWSTPKLGICYGGDERPADGPLSEEEHELREIHRRHREEVERAFETLERLWGTTLDREWGKQ